MRFKGTIVLLALALVLGGYYFLYFVPKQNRLRIERQLREKLFNVSPDKVDYIRLIEGSKEFELKKRDSRWLLTKPKKLPADGAIIEKIIDVLNKEKIKKVITTDIDRAPEFGLSPPYIYAFFGHGGQIDEFFVGKPNPSGTGVYLYRRGLDAIFLVSKDVASALSHDLYSLRNKVPFEFNREGIRRLVVKRAQDTLDIYKIPAGWFMHSPFRGRCSYKNVLKLIDDIATVRAEEFFDDQKPDPTFFSKSAKIELYDEGSNPKVIDVYYWGTSADTGIVVYQQGLSYYARVGRDFWNNIHRDASLFRYRNLFEFNPEKVETIRLEEGKNVFSITRKNGRWYYSGKELDETFKELIELLLDIEAYRIVAEQGSIDRDSLRFSIELTGNDGRSLGRLDVYNKAPLNRYAFSEKGELVAYFAVTSNLKDTILVTNLQIDELKKAFMKVIQEVD